MGMPRMCHYPGAMLFSLICTLYLLRSDTGMFPSGQLLEGLG